MWMSIISGQGQSTRHDQPCRIAALLSQTNLVNAFPIDVSQTRLHDEGHANTGTLAVPPMRRKPLHPLALHSASLCRDAPHP